MIHDKEFHCEWLFGIDSVSEDVRVKTVSVMVDGESDSGW